MTVERRPPEEWAEIAGVIVGDPDGWRTGTTGYGPQHWSTPISRTEFEARAAASTILYLACRACGELHRPPECPIDSEGHALASCGCRWTDLDLGAHGCRLADDDESGDRVLSK